MGTDQFWGLFGARRLPVILQSEASECGLAAMAMVASFYGNEVTLAELRSKHNVSLKGIDLPQLIDIGDRLGLMARPLRIEMEYLSELKTPCVLHWNFGHFVVLERVGSAHVIIHDPAVGRRKVMLTEVSKRFTGIAVEFFPNSQFTPSAPAPRVGVLDLIGRVRGLKRAVGKVLFIALTLEIFVLISPLFMQIIVDGVVPSKDTDLLLLAAVGFCVVGLTQQLLTAARSWVILKLNTSTHFQWTSSVFAHMLRLPSSFYERRHMGDVVARFQSVGSIQRTLSAAFIEGVLDGLLAVLTMCMILYYSPPLACISISAAVLYGSIRWFAYRPLRDATTELLQKTARQQTYFLESIRGIRSIQIFNAQSSRQSFWVRRLSEQVGAELSAQMILIALKLFNGILFTFERVAVVLFASLFVLDGKLTLGMLVAYLAYKEQFVQRISGLIDRMLDLRMLRVYTEQLADIVLTEPEPRSDRQLNADVVEGSVEFENVRFRYGENEAFVLDGVSFRVQPGQSVAIVGSSGCGKSTLLKLLLGVLKPQDGVIRVGGIDVSKAGYEEVRKLMGAVMQDDTLFAGSLRENISFFDANVDEERVRVAASNSAILEEIEAMPMKFETPIGEMGATLSGGQQQRVLLARALYKRPLVLVLDEATSHLDLKNEAAVNAAIRDMTVTRLFAAHRPDTIDMADRVITLFQGRVQSDRIVARSNLS
jgi:ATP-binding cassette, subfamily B, bacterial CvaB/MchF/RaxB